ncbi:hypothetical protein HXX01_05490, partial [Candidatus Nomurabacteria bacterium]|nr:hypothetical protein [Candidatus Nomurabacteria bacterium]
MRVFLSTVIRGDTNPEATGFLLEVDWAAKKVINKLSIPIDSSNPFWNARGGNRGGRGISLHNGVLYVGTATSILKYDTNLNLIGSLDHPLLAGLHEMYAEEDGIWVTSTVHDLVMKISFDGEVLDQWWGSESIALQQQLGYSGRSLNLGMDFSNDNFVNGYEQYCNDERLHLNTVWVNKGQVYVLACRKNAFIRIRPLPEKLIIKDDLLHSPHNGIITPDGEVLINNTSKQVLHVYDLSTGKLIRNIPTRIFHEDHSEQFAKAGWQRGLA